MTGSKPTPQLVTTRPVKIGNDVIFQFHHPTSTTAKPVELGLKRLVELGYIEPIVPLAQVISHPLSVWFLVKPFGMKLIIGDKLEDLRKNK